MYSTAAGSSRPGHRMGRPSAARPDRRPADRDCRRSCWPTSPICRPRPSTRRVCLLRSPPGCTWESAATAEADLALRRDLIALQRRTLSDLRQQGRIGVTTLRIIERTSTWRRPACPLPEPSRRSMNRSDVCEVRRRAEGAVALRYGPSASRCIPDPPYCAPPRPAGASCPPAAPSRRNRSRRSPAPPNVLAGLAPYLVGRGRAQPVAGRGRRRVAGAAAIPRAGLGAGTPGRCLGTTTRSARGWMVQRTGAGRVGPAWAVERAPWWLLSRPGSTCRCAALVVPVGGAADHFGVGAERGVVHERGLARQDLRR